MKDVDLLTKDIQELKNSLIEEKEYDTIINSMINQGE